MLLVQNRYIKNRDTGSDVNGVLFEGYDGYFYCSQYEEDDDAATPLVEENPGHISDCDKATFVISIEKMKDENCPEKCKTETITRNLFFTKEYS